MRHVFGYTIINDLTSPTMRRRHFHYRPSTEERRHRRMSTSYLGHLLRPYKGSDGFGPIGP